MTHTREEFTDIDPDIEREIIEEEAQETREAYSALSATGRTGIYDAFHNLPDAIRQMDRRIRELEHERTVAQRAVDRIEAIAEEFYPDATDVFVSVPDEISEAYYERVWVDVLDDSNVSMRRDGTQEGDPVVDQFWLVSAKWLHEHELGKAWLDYEHEVRND